MRFMARKGGQDEPTSLAEEEARVLVDHPNSQIFFCHLAKTSVGSRFLLVGYVGILLD